MIPLSLLILLGWSLIWTASLTIREHQWYELMFLLSNGWVGMFENCRCLNAGQADLSFVLYIENITHGGANIWIYLRVEKILFFFPREDKLQMFAPPSNFLSITGISVSKITLVLQCPKQRNDVSDIFNSEDIENISLVSRM